MKTVHPVTTGYLPSTTHKNMKALQPHAKLHSDSNLAEDNELRVAQERLYEAHQNLLDAERHLAT
eukprot:8235340-Ditylum_brightwellii.AAC.1